MMSRLCYQQEFPPTRTINFEEIDPLPEQDKFALIKNGDPLYTNYLQAIDRYTIDVFTANIFSALHSKQNDFDMNKLFNLFKAASRSNISLLDPDELDVVNDLWDYKIRNKKEIIPFLIEHIEIVPILQEARTIIKNYFNKSSLVLEVVTDPEEEKDSRILFIYIQTNLSPNDALSKLEKLDEDWWLDVSKEIGELMCLHVEYL